MEGTAAGVCHRFSSPFFCRATILAYKLPPIDIVAVRPLENLRNEPARRLLRYAVDRIEILLATPVDLVYALPRVPSPMAESRHSASR